RHVTPASFRREQRGDGGGVERVGANAVHRVGGQHDEPAALYRGRGCCDSFRPLRFVSALKNLRHDALFLRAVTKRGRLAKSVCEAMSVKDPLLQSNPVTAEDASSSCSTANIPPARSHR